MSVAHLPPPPEPPDDLAEIGPADLPAERTILGCILHGDRHALDDVTSAITGADYADPRHELIHDAVVHLYARGEPVDPVAVIDRLRRTKSLTRAGGPAYIAEIHAGVVITTNAGYYADIVADTAQRRRLLAQAHHLAQLALTPGDIPVADIVERHRTDLDTVTRAVPGVERDSAPGVDIDTFLGADDEDQYNWLVDGVLERQDRLIVTAAEGMGKSTLLRQLAIQMAAGVHPFTEEILPGVKVLLLDLENSTRQTRRKIRPLRIRAGGRLDPTNLIIECRTSGIDLTTDADRAWLSHLVAAHRPDVLITGPIYKMGGGNPNAEEDAKPVALALDALRERHDMAVILEAHTRKAEGIDPRKRAKEPIGWSGWMRWPEFGLHLSDEGEITHWRGGRDERVWPNALSRGGAWPWTPAVSVQEQRWGAIRGAVRAAGRRLTNREIADATGLGLGTVGRLVSDRAGEMATLVHSVEVGGQGIGGTP